MNAISNYNLNHIIRGINVVKEQATCTQLCVCVASIRVYEAQAASSLKSSSSSCTTFFTLGAAVAGRERVRKVMNMISGQALH